MGKICKSLQLVGLTPDDRRALEAVSERIAIAANEWVTIWHQWHRENGSAEQVASWAASLRDWHRADKATRGEKPKLPVSFAPPQLQERLKYWSAKTTTGHKRTNRRCLELLANWLRRKLTSSSSGFPEWIEVLLNRRRAPQFLSGLPVPIDRKNATVFVRENANRESELWVKFRIDRIEREGKNATSTEHEFKLRAGGKVQRYAAPVWSAAKSGGAIAGAQLVSKQSCRKWLVAFTVDAEDSERKPLSESKVAVVCPGWSLPFLVRVVDGSGAFRHGYRAEHIGHLRRKIMRQRLSRQNFYRIGAGQRRKGHGRKRAMVSWEGRLSRQWQSITKLNNNQWSHDLAERLVKLQGGTVVLIQPTDGRRFLETTGILEGYEHASGWDWTQWIAMAARKLSREGISVRVVKDSHERRMRKRPASQDVA